jgi:hypothetical protein
MTENSSPNYNPIIGSNENKILVLMARKRELLLRKKLIKDENEMQHVDKLLEDVECNIRKLNVSTTIQRRIKRQVE